MAEIRRGAAGEGAGRPGPATGERLPWLDPVDEPEEGIDGAPGGYRGALLAAFAVLVLIGLATVAMLGVRHRAIGSADASQIIRPEPGPYKVRPADPGGMKPDMSEQVAARTGAGQDIDAPLDVAALPEAAIVTARAAPPAVPAAVAKAQPGATAYAAAAPAREAAPAPAPPPKAAPAAVAAKAPVRPEPPAGPGGAIQLGAFSSEAKAKAAWKALSGRFDFLADMTPSFAAATVGQATLYRLRATGGSVGSPAAICARLRLAGESCAVIGG